MDIHYHKPLTALARARQLRGYWFHLDPQTQKREVNENKSKEENSIKNKERIKEKLRLNAARS